MKRNLILAIVFQLIGWAFVFLVSCNVNFLWSVAPYTFGKVFNYVVCYLSLLLACFFEIRLRKEIGGFYPKLACILSFAYSMSLFSIFYFLKYLNFNVLTGFLPLTIYIIVEIGMSCYMFAYLKRE